MDAADIFALPVHPAADVFPMLAEDELEELAASIKQQGLQHPLVVQEIDGKLVLIDGRNRREACRRAGVTPATTMLNGVDPVAYILSVNINRRHLTKGQRAMATAKLKPETTMGRNSKVKELASRLGVSGEYLRQARYVLRHTPDNAALVLSGVMALDAAYKHAHEVTLSAEGEEGQMRALRAEAPDLADQVIEGTLTLSEASAALRQREKEERQRKYDDAQALYRLEDAAMLVLNDERIEATARFIVHERAIYEDYAKRPASGLVRALQLFHENAGKVLDRISKEGADHA